MRDLAPLRAKKDLVGRKIVDVCFEMVDAEVDADEKTVRAKAICSITLDNGKRVVFHDGKDVNMDGYVHASIYTPTPHAGGTDA